MTKMLSCFAKSVVYCAKRHPDTAAKLLDDLVGREVAASGGSQVFECRDGARVRIAFHEADRHGEYFYTATPTA